MAKFKLTQNVRIEGKHFDAGSIVELDAADPRQRFTLSALIASDRVVETDAAHAHIAQADAKSLADAEAAKLKEREAARAKAPGMKDTAQREAASPKPQP